MIKNKFVLPTIAVLFMVISGCSSSKVDTSSTMGEETGSMTSGASTTESMSGTEISSSSSGGSTDASSENLLDQRIVYFEYDSSSLDDLARRIVEAHAQNSLQNPGVKLRLVGHADERGSREYNLALGDRRAASVNKMFQANGISSSRIYAISMGEEEPAALGHDEESWQMNRRVEIVYE